MIDGRLQFDQWKDQSGIKRSKHSIAVESMQMLDSKNDNSQSSEPQQQSPQQTDASRPEYNAPKHQSYTPPPEHGYSEEDEIPFAYIGLTDKRIIHII